MASIAQSILLIVFATVPCASAIVVPPFIHSSSIVGPGSVHEGSAPAQPSLLQHVNATASSLQRSRHDADVAEPMWGGTKKTPADNVRPADVEAREATALLEVKSARNGRDGQGALTNRSQVNATIGNSVATAAEQQEKLHTEVKALEQRRAELKLELGTQGQAQMRLQLQAQAHAELEAQVHSEAAEAVHGQVKAQLKSQRLLAEKQARAHAEADMERESQKAMQQFQGRMDSTASTVVTIETSLEDAAVRIEGTVNWLEKMHKDYPNGQAFFLASFLLVGIGCGFSVCWGDVERLTMRKDRTQI